LFPQIKQSSTQDSQIIIPSVVHAKYRHGSALLRVYFISQKAFSNSF
jgi:hypothetical protein